MPPAPSAQHLHFLTSDTRPASDRQITSRTAWRQGLPTAPIAANDNEAPISRPAPAKRNLTLEALLAWTYRQQRTHAIIRGPIDKFLWAADQADLLANPADRRPVHIDAMTVHEAVMALGTDLAAMVIEAALFGDWPAWMDPESPRPVPVEPSDRYDNHGWYVDAGGRRREYLIRTEIISIPRQEYVQVGRKKMRAANDNGFERVPVDRAVIRWEPEPEFIEANNRLVAQWQAARPVLVQALRDEPGEPRFRDHVLAANAANDNAPTLAAANDNESLENVRVA